jgi:hypothetical protein
MEVEVVKRFGDPFNLFMVNRFGNIEVWSTNGQTLEPTKTIADIKSYYESASKIASECITGDKIRLDLIILSYLRWQIHVVSRLKVLCVFELLGSNHTPLCQTKQNLIKMINASVLL